MKPQLLLLLCSILLLAVSCGGGNDQGTALSAGQSGQPLAEVSVPGLENSGLPELDALPELPRELSNTPADCIRKGSEIATPSSRENAIAIGDGLVMAPDWNPGGSPPTTELSWGIYGFFIPGYARSGEVDLSWDTAPDSADTFVAITDYSTGRWRWLSGNAENNFDFGDISDHFSGFSTVYVAVLLAGEGSYQLDRVRLGGNFAPTASFTVDQDSGQYSLTTGFNGAASSDIDGSIAEYHWSFEDPVYFTPGDLGPTPNYNYDHVGTFTCTLRVIDNEGGTGEATAMVTVTGEPGNLPPTAVILSSKSGGPLPQGISFDGFGSSDPDDIIMRYRWDLDGDGYHEYNSNNIPSAYREFITAGTFNVSLMVIDFFGAFDTDSTEIVITPITGENPPTAELSVDYYCLQTGQLRIIDTSAITDPDNDIIRHEWDFEGDGTFDYDYGLFAGGDITYNLPGVYTPTLRVTDSGGRQATASLEVIVSNGVDPQESEPNNSTGEANSLGGFMNYAKFIRDWRGQLGPADMDDWYVIESDRMAEASFWVDYSSAQIDIAIELYSADNLAVPIGFSDFGSDREYFHLQIPAAGTYYLRVFIPEFAVQTGPGGYSLVCLENHLPQAALTGSPLNGTVPFNINLDATGSFDPDNDIVSFDYDLDADGIYEAPFEWDTYSGMITQTGTHFVAVRVTDVHGETSVAYLEVTGNP